MRTLRAIAPIPPLPGHPAATYQGLSYAYIGANVQARAQQDRQSYRLYSWAAIVWGAYTILSPYRRLWGPPTIWHDLPGMAMETTVALGMVFLYYGLLRARQQETESRYRALFDAAANGILVISRAGRVLDGNAAVCRMLGYAAEELAGKNAAELLNVRGGAPLEDPWAMLEEAGPRGEIWGRRRNGETFPCGVATSRVIVQGQGALMAHLRDRSNQHEADQALRIASRVFAPFPTGHQPIMLLIAEGITSTPSRRPRVFDCAPDDFIGA